MSKISLEPNASGAGTFSIVSPDSNINRTLNLPDVGGTFSTREDGSWEVSGMKATWVSGTEVQISEGQALSDVEFFLIKLPSSVTVDLTTTGAGGLAAGDTIPTEGTLHFHAIADSTGTNPVSVVASTTAAPAQTAGALVSGYDRSRRIFSARVDNSNNVVSFFTKGRNVFTQLILEFSGDLGYTSREVFVPEGIRVIPKLWVGMAINPSGGTTHQLRFNHGIGDGNSEFPRFDLPFFYAGSDGGRTFFMPELITNKSAQIRMGNQGGGSSSIQVYTSGWFDFLERRAF